MPLNQTRSTLDRAAITYIQHRAKSAPRETPLPEHRHGVSGRAYPGQDEPVFGLVAWLKARLRRRPS